MAEFIYGSLAENPERVGRELQLELVGCHAAHRGDYRVIYQIDRSKGAVLIVHVDHRADVYQGLAPRATCTSPTTVELS